MTTAYWSQYNHAEIMSMHGVELDEVDTDLCQEKDDTDLCQNLCDCLNCIDCCGFSFWRDFM